MTEPTKKPARRRARKPDGKFQGNDPSTPTNEAWEPIPLEREVGKKDVKYGVKQKVSGTSKDTAGKYGKKPQVKNPTFGKVYSVSN